MKYKSVFDIIGPVMIGPSSSHTAGTAGGCQAEVGSAAATPTCALEAKIFGMPLVTQ